MSKYTACLLIFSWTIDTNYYTADVCIGTVRLDELDSKDNGPPLENCEALLMVFDLSDVRGISTISLLAHCAELLVRVILFPHLKGRVGTQ